MVRRVSPDGILSTVAGGTTCGFLDGVPATNAQMRDTNQAILDPFSGNMYIADSLNRRIRVVTPDGMMATYAGNGQEAVYNAVNGDGGMATNALMSRPHGLAVDTAGVLYIADYSNRKVRMVGLDGIITTFAGMGQPIPAFSGDGGPASLAQLSFPVALAFHVPTGNMYIADAFQHCIRMVAAGGIISTVAAIGNAGWSGDNGPATLARINQPYSVAVDTVGNFFIGDMGNQRIRRVDAVTRIITTLAGTGVAGFSGDGGPAFQAQTSNAQGVWVTAAGDLLIADVGNSRVRRVAANADGVIAREGIITTVVSSGLDNNYLGDGGQATSAQLGSPTAVCLDPAGNVYFADTETNRVRRVDQATGIITTAAGTGFAASSGDGGPASSASLDAPGGITIDSAGNLYIPDFFGSVVRRVTAATGIISTIAGTVAGYAGDGGLAVAAQLGGPNNVAVDLAGNIFISDWGNIRVRRITPAGIISTVAGNGVDGFTGDGGPGTLAAIASVMGLALDGAGNLFMADAGSSRVRMLTPAGIISTVAGNGVEGFSGDNGPATAAALTQPYGLAINGGTLFISCQACQRIRQLDLASGVISSTAGTGVVGFSGDNGPATSAQLNAMTEVAVDAAGRYLYISDTINLRVRVVPLQ